MGRGSEHGAGEEVGVVDDALVYLENLVTEFEMMFFAAELKAGSNEESQ
jgi:hypothetical protein